VPNGVILYYTVYCDEAIAETGSGTSGIGEPLPDETTTSSVVTTVSGNETSAVVTGLTPYTFYDCYVTANTSIGEGHVSVVDSAQTDESGQSAHIHTHSHDYMTLHCSLQQSLEMHPLTSMQLWLVPLPLD